MCGGSELRDAGEVDGFAFVECGGCGFVFSPTLTREYLDAYYRRGTHGPQDGAPAVGWADSTAFLDPALDLLGRDRPLRILDFGAGQSFLPDALRAAGHRVIACDLVPPLRPHPDRLTGCIMVLDLPCGSFDLVYAFQVFEHLPEPRRYLTRLLELARPGDGLVVIHTDMETPERDHADGLAGWWYVSPPDHCAFYRHRTFATALGGQPHRIVWCGPKHVIIRAGAVPGDCARHHGRPVASAHSFGHPL